MRFALATPAGPRFFTGRYDQSASIPTPYTTARPDRAREYDDRNVARLVSEYLNLLDGLRAREPRRNWIVVELPEAWI